MTEQDLFVQALNSTIQGTWTGSGVDVFPTPSGPQKTDYTETTTFGEVFQTINPGGPKNRQVLDCVHYSTNLVNAQTKKPMHQETGYWLIDAAQTKFIKAIAIPRGISILAGGTYHIFSGSSRDPIFVLNASANVGSPTFGISSDHFLSSVSPTTRFNITIELTGDRMSYKEDSILKIDEQYLHHTDEATLSKVSL
ncbi:MAG: FABP family protein [Symploca sp. SIO1B1]|nr:FABP family protein [Symploca sp. SIO1B1]